MWWIISYIIIGVVVSIFSWLFFSSKLVKRNVNEGDIFGYLFVCALIWPVLIVSFVFEIYKWLRHK